MHNVSLRGLARYRVNTEHCSAWGTIEESWAMRGENRSVLLSCGDDSVYLLRLQGFLWEIAFFADP